MATLHHDHEGHGFLYLKGAPERLLAMCETSRSRKGDIPIDRAAWHERIRQLAGLGMRTLAIAMKRIPSGQHELRFEDV
jgi:Ca2+-transporting ATPase